MFRMVSVSLYSSTVSWKLTIWFISGGLISFMLRGVKNGWLGCSVTDGARAMAITSGFRSPFSMSLGTAAVLFICPF